MGCDIHIYSESKIDNEWVLNEPCVEETEAVEEDVYESYLYTPYSERFYSGRSYSLFGVIAGVRRPEYQVFKRKGLPINVSQLVKQMYESWEDNAHSSSYITLDELRSFNENFTGQKLINDMDQKYLYNTGLDVALSVLKDWQVKLETMVGDDHRVVFWFDN